MSDWFVVVGVCKCKGTISITVRSNRSVLHSASSSSVLHFYRSWTTTTATAATITIALLTDRVAYWIKYTRKLCWWWWRGNLCPSAIAYMCLLSRHRHHRTVEFTRVWIMNSKSTRISYKYPQDANNGPQSRHCSENVTIGKRKIVFCLRKKKRWL